MEVLIINGTDYSSAIASKGYGWSRNDLDSDKTTRTKDGTMRRDKITTKRKLRYTTHSVKRDVLAKLDDDLNKPTCAVQYLDLHGMRTSTFYCSSMECTLEEAADDNEVWGGATFNLTEV
jgi:hypothetical protein